MNFTLKVEGFRELERNLAKLPAAVAKEVAKEALTKAGEPIRKRAAILAPDAPPLGKGLTASIIVGSELNRTQFMASFKSGDRSGVEVYVGPETKTGRHGHLQEFGTVNHGPHPFMRPAFAEKWRDSLDIISVELGKSIERAVKRMEV